jgi:hypothetical protein
VAVGSIAGRTWVFAGLRKQGGIVFADVTDPTAPGQIEYESTRLFDQDTTAISPQTDTATYINCAVEASAPGQRSDLGPEGLLFIPALLSPSFRPLLVVEFMTSGSTRIFEIEP